MVMVTAAAGVLPCPIQIHCGNVLIVLQHKTEVFLNNGRIF